MHCGFKFVYPRWKNGNLIEGQVIWSSMKNQSRIKKRIEGNDSNRFSNEERRQRVRLTRVFDGKKGKAKALKQSESVGRLLTRRDKGNS